MGKFIQWLHVALSKPPGRLGAFIAGALTLVILVCAWELAGRNGAKFTRVIPPPTSFIQELKDDGFKIGLGSQAVTIPASIASSMFRVFVGLAIGFMGALIFGFLISMNGWLRAIFMPLIRLFAPIAPIAWIPLALVILGIGNQTAIFIVFMGVFFTLTIAAVQAIEEVPREYLNAATSFGARPWQLWCHVIFPHILPHVFTMLRINFIAAWMAVLAAEMTGLQDGLGAIIMIGRNLFNSNLILLGMVLIGVTGFIGDYLLKKVQTTFFWWGGK